MHFLLSKRKALTIIIAIFVFFIFSKNLFAYDEVIVHPSLTSEMAKLYNLEFGEKLTDQEIEWMKKGSKDEDERQGLLIRSGNHFYNPFGLKKWADNTLVGNSVPEPKLTAKEWAHDSLEQDSFPGGDFTWERAIWDYANGDKQHAYESLGHIMHLIEDSTVPAHVRNDLHISPNDKDLAPYRNIPNFEEIKKNLQDGEPYEAWTGGQAWNQSLKYDFASGLFQENKKPLALINIDEYFDNIAKYTNTNFFSKDTIYVYFSPKEYAIEGNEKKDNGDLVGYVYGLDENKNKFKLARIFDENSQHQKMFIVNDKTPEVHSDYWSRLAPRAVLTGAGIIKLFKDEANKAAQNPQSIKRPKSIASVFGPLSPAVRTADPAIRTIATVAQLQLNAEIYFAKKALSAAQNIIISAFDKAISSAIAFYNWEKAQAVAAYNIARTATVTVFNKTKTGLQLAKKYAVNSANSIAGKLNESSNSIYRYFTSTAKAQLEFDFSNPLPENTYSFKDIVEKTKIASIAKTQTQTIDEPAYSGNIRILNQDQKLFFSPGEEIALSAEIKNTGTAIWQGDKISLNIYSAKSSDFYHPSWFTKVRPADLGKMKIAPGATGIFNFIAIAPLLSGDYIFRIRPVWQNESGEFNWIGKDILSWNIRVEAPQVAANAEENLPELPNKNTEPVSEAAKQEEENLPAENDLPPKEIVPGAGENIDKEKSEAEALAAAEAAKLEEETARLEEEAEAARLEKEKEILTRRRRAWVSTVPETAIVEAPDKITKETAASFKFSSTKGGGNFLCSLKETVSLAEDNFVYCAEYAVFENLAGGEYVLKVKAKDEYGNIDETPAEYSWVIEKAESAPLAPVSGFIAEESANNANSIRLSWNAPPDAGGADLLYDIRMRESDQEIISQEDFDGAAIVPNAPAIAANAVQEVEITDLDLELSYCFAIQVKNAEGEKSEIISACYNNEEPEVPML